MNPVLQNRPAAAARNAPGLIRFDDVAGLSQTEIAELHEAHLNSGLVKLMKMGNFHKVKIARAEGPYIYTDTGRALLDCVSSYGALNLGHNHPRLVEAKRKVLDGTGAQLCKELLGPWPAALARNLAAVTPGGLQQTFFCNSGAEAIEGAMKLAERAAGKKRHLFLYAKDSMHGKTRGALSVTGRDKFRGECTLLDNCVEFPFGHIDALAALLADLGSKTIAVLLEPIQGEAGVVVPPAGYLGEVAALCRKQGALLILDEVQTGFGRTGRLFGCDRDGVVPDILCMAKSLGGGMVPIGAYITTPDIYKRAYGKINQSVVHTSTFGGMSESCAVALEAVNLVIDENLPERAARTGAILKGRLMELKDKHPDLIEEVRGTGMMLALIFKPARVQGGVPPLGMAINKILGTYFPGLLAAELLNEHDMITSFTLNNDNALRMYTSLFIGTREIDQIVGALDAVLSAGLDALVRKGLKRAVASVGLHGIWNWLTDW